MNRYHYYSSDNTVVAWGTSTVVVLHSGEVLGLNITLRMGYVEGKLVRIEDRSKITAVESVRKSMSTPV